MDIFSSLFHRTYRNAFVEPAIQRGSMQAMMCHLNSLSRNVKMFIIQNKQHDSRINEIQLVRVASFCEMRSNRCPFVSFHCGEGAQSRGRGRIIPLEYCRKICKDGLWRHDRTYKICSAITFVYTVNIINTAFQ